MATLPSSDPETGGAEKKDTVAWGVTVVRFLPQLQKFIVIIRWTF